MRILFLPRHEFRRYRLQHPFLPSNLVIAPPLPDLAAPADVGEFKLAIDITNAQYQRCIKDAGAFLAKDSFYCMIERA